MTPLIELPPSKTDHSTIVFNMFTKSMRWLEPLEMLWLEPRKPDAGGDEEDVGRHAGEAREDAGGGPSTSGGMGTDAGGAGGSRCLSLHMTR